MSHESNNGSPLNNNTSYRTPEILVTYGKFGDLHPKEPPKGSLCNFCKNNKETYEFYSSHTVKSCPIIKMCRCPLCGETGHTMGHCSKNPSKASITRLIGIFNTATK